jgi:hypothetical protein
VTSPSYILLTPEDLQVLADEEMTRMAQQGSHLTVTLDPGSALAVGALLLVCCTPGEDEEEDAEAACDAAHLVVTGVKRYFESAGAWATLELLRRYLS